MTMIGGRKVNKKGRSTGQLKTNKRTKILGQLVPHLRDLLESPVWQVLSLSARRVLDRIELEHMDHGGGENGRLPVTFEDFERYGIRRNSISPAIQQCAALGLVEITQVGRAGNSEFRQPNKFRLTYLTAMGRDPATHEWRRITTIEEAQQTTRSGKTRPRKNRIPLAKSLPCTTPRNVTTGTQFHSNETASTAKVTKRRVLSISPGGGGHGATQQHRTADPHSAVVLPLRRVQQSTPSAAIVSPSLPDDETGGRQC
jgi:hypothetical protein